MDTQILKLIYNDMLQVPFPNELVGQFIDSIDLSLFDTGLKSDVSQLIYNLNYLSQDQIRKYIRKTQYIIDGVKDLYHREYFEQWEFVLINCLAKFDKIILKRFIRQDLQSVNTFENLHGIDLGNIYQHMVDPIVRNYYNDFQDKVEECWLVLDEEPVSLEVGYQIIYSEKQNEFGLASKTSNTKQGMGTLVGWYGSFVSTLNNM